MDQTYDAERIVVTFQPSASRLSDLCTPFRILNEPDQLFFQVCGLNFNEWMIRIFESKSGRQTRASGNSHGDRLEGIDPVAQVANLVNKDIALFF